VTRKITRALARIKVGLQKTLYLGNLDAKRDWGHARDYVEMQWLMLQQAEPRDYVIATGNQYSVREFVELACEQLGIKVVFEGAGVEEKGRDAATGDVIVAVDPRYFRPTEVETLLGDPSDAEQRLGWRPRTTFKVSGGGGRWEGGMFISALFISLASHNQTNQHLKLSTLKTNNQQPTNNPKQRRRSWCARWSRRTWCRRAATSTRSAAGSRSTRRRRATSR
jgi:hypothetical protein